jgi:hypothetical protein
MLKLSILRENDWDVKLAFDELDSQDQGFVNAFNLYGFAKANGYDASDEELISIIRRIEG